MSDIRGEGVVVLQEPQPLGVEIDPASAALWEEFMAGGNGGGRRLVEVNDLWKDPAVNDPGIRQRAVTVLTAPHGYSVPFTHPSDTIGRFLNIKEEKDGSQTSALRQRLAGQMRLPRELAAGVLYWLEDANDGTGRQPDSPSYYQRMITELLPLVDKETADNLFEHYSMEDLTPFSSGALGPVTALLYNREIPRDYKDAAVARWVEVAEEEMMTGTVQSRTGRTGVQDMAEFIGTWKGANVDEKAHTSIIGFLEGVIPEGETYVYSIATTEVAQRVTDPEIKFSFALRHISHGGFEIRNSSDLAFIRWMREEAEAHGLSHFDAKAGALEKDYHARRRKEAAAQTAELALQAKLRS